jgi:hemolysin activation/secretion protein
MNPFAASSQNAYGKTLLNTLMTNPCQYPAGVTQGLRCGGRLLCVLLGLLLPCTVAAQSPVGQGFSKRIIDPREDALPAPDTEDEGRGPGLVLPPVAAPSTGTDTREGVQVFVRRFRFSGNTVITGAELKALTSAYPGRWLSSRELVEVKDVITTEYVRRGYISSGAFIPDQRVSDGVIDIQVEEGMLGKIEVTSDGRLHERFLTERLEEAQGTPLNIGALQQRLQLLQRKPQIDAINAVLLPGRRRGESVLQMQVTEARPWYLTLKANNHNSPSLGAEGVELDAGHYNVSGHGDSLGIQYLHTGGLDDFYGFYSLPLDASDTTLQLLYEKTRAEIIEEPFDILDIENDYESYAVGVSRPLFRKPDEHLMLGLLLEYRHSESALLNVPFPFFAGSDNGSNTLSVLRFSQEWLQRSPTRVLALRSVFSQGLDLFGASTGSGSPDTRFLAWLGQFQWTQRLSGSEAQMLFRLDAQLSRDALLPMEKFVVGGRETVRGYRENQLVRDNGVVASLEFRIPLLRAADGNPVFQLAPFIDYGNAWESDGPTQSPRHIASAGLGLLWDPLDRLHLEVYAAAAFRNIEHGIGSHDLQDDGIYLEIEYKAL